MTSPSSSYKDPAFVPGTGKTQDIITLPAEAAVAVSLWGEVQRSVQAYLDDPAAPDVDPDAKRDEIRARVAAAPADLREQVAPYLETALTHPVAGRGTSAMEPLRLRWQLVQTLKAMVPPPPRVTGYDTSTHCRHGNPYSGACAACDAEFA